MSVDNLGKEFARKGFSRPSGRFLSDKCLRSRGSDALIVWDISLINQTINSSVSGVCTLFLTDIAIVVIIWLMVVSVMMIVTSIPNGAIYR